MAVAAGHLTAPDDRVFLSPTGGSLDEGDVRDGALRALAAAKIGHLRELAEPIVFHDLRHTFGTLAVQVWPVTDVQAYMGHADIKTTMRYVHHVPKHDAAERFSRFVEGSSACPRRVPNPRNQTPLSATPRNWRPHRKATRAGSAALLRRGRRFESCSGR